MKFTLLVLSLASTISYAGNKDGADDLFTNPDKGTSAQAVLGISELGAAMLTFGPKNIKTLNGLISAESKAASERGALGNQASELHNQINQNAKFRDQANKLTEQSAAIQNQELFWPVQGPSSDWDRQINNQRQYLLNEVYQQQSKVYEGMAKTGYDQADMDAKFANINSKLAANGKAIALERQAAIKEMLSAPEGASKLVGVIKKVRVAGTALLLTDVAGRIWVWGAMDKNPTLSPLATFASAEAKKATKRLVDDFSTTEHNGNSH